MENSKTDVSRPSKNDIYYSQTASSLSKRPLQDIYEEKEKKKGGEKSAAMKPSTKKSFHNVTSKVDCGVKKKSVTASTGHQSDGLTAKRRDELFGRVTIHSLAKFLNQKYTQQQFVFKCQSENQVRLDDRGSDFNFTDAGYVTQFSHEIRLNKRPITAKPAEKFGKYTQGLLSIDNTKQQGYWQDSQRSNQDPNSLQGFLNITKQNVVLLDMRGEGTQAQKEFNEFHIVGSVSFPHGWLNRANQFGALQRFKNLNDKIIIVFMDNERQGTAVAKTLTEKGFGNIYLLTGGIQAFFIDYPDLIDGVQIPDYHEFKKWVETSLPSPSKAKK